MFSYRANDIFDALNLNPQRSFFKNVLMIIKLFLTTMMVKTCKLWGHKNSLHNNTTIVNDCIFRV